MTLWLSWSRLRSHEECKQKGYLERGHKRAPLANERVFFPGNVTDRIVRDLLNMEDAPDRVNDLPDMVDAQMDTLQEEIATKGGIMTFKSTVDERDVREDCKEAALKIIPALKTLVLPYEFQADYRFKAPLMAPHPNGGKEKIVINGAMDILVRDPERDAWAVYDVKHTKDKDYWRKTQGQLGFYDLAVKIAHDGAVYDTALLQPLVEGEPVKHIPLGEDSRRLMLQRVVRMAQEVWKGENQPRTDSKYCTFCDVKHACSKYKPTMVNGRRTLPFG